MKMSRILSASLIILLSFSFSLFLNGCDQNAVDPGVTGIRITGTVGDPSGNPLPGLSVIIGSSNTVTASDGTFSIDGVVTPYDLKLFQNSTGTGLVYRDLTAQTPYISAIGITASVNSADLTISIPSLTSIQKALVFFTDGEYMESKGEIPFPSNSVTLSPKWSGTSSITGKVIVLVYSKVGTEVLSYNNYGEKAGVSLSNGSTSNVTFTSADIATDPGETNVSGTVTAPSGYSSVNSTIEITFRMSGPNFNGGGSLQFTSGTSFNYLVPAAVASNFRLFVNATANGSVTGQYTSRSSQVAVGSTGNNLILDDAPVLNLPIGASTNIDTNTSFSFVPGAGIGVNLMYFSSPSSKFYVFTNYSAGTIPNFSASGLGIGSSVNYQWLVEKLSGIPNTNQMVSTSFSRNTQFAGVADSETRTFTTSP